MSLWPGYYLGNELPEPILTEIPKIRINPDRDWDIKVEMPGGDFYQDTTNMLRAANGMLALEGFGAGETFSWIYAFDEFAWIVRGKAEMTYSLSGTSHTEQKTVTIKEGDIFLIPLGARITFKVDPSGPLRKIGCTLPGIARTTRRPDKVTKLR